MTQEERKIAAINNILGAAGIILGSIAEK